MFYHTRTIILIIATMLFISLSSSPCQAQNHRAKVQLKTLFKNKIFSYKTQQKFRLQVLQIASLFKGKNSYKRLKQKLSNLREKTLMSDAKSYTNHSFKLRFNLHRILNISTDQQRNFYINKLLKDVKHFYNKPTIQIVFPTN